MVNKCDYGCWFMRKCQGSHREEVIEFLNERTGIDHFALSNADLNKCLSDLFDVDYKGPNHVTPERKHA